MKNFRNMAIILLVVFTTVILALGVYYKVNMAGTSNSDTKKIVNIEEGTINDIAKTGIKATIDSKKEGPHIALLCELDSVPSTEHKYLGKRDNCAHSCGHYAQVGMMLGTFLALKESNIIDELGGKVSFIATPAEEYCDFDYREN